MGHHYRTLSRSPAECCKANYPNASHLRPRVPGAAQRRRRLPALVRCRPGIVTHRLCNGPGPAVHRSQGLALHRIRDTPPRVLPPAVTPAQRAVACSRPSFSGCSIDGRLSLNSSECTLWARSRQEFPLRRFRFRQSRRRRSSPGSTLVGRRSRHVGVDVSCVHAHHQRSTAAVGVYAGYIDTDMAAAATFPKSSPDSIAACVIAGIENDEEEILADERAQSVHSELFKDHRPFESNMQRIRTTTCDGTLSRCDGRGQNPRRRVPDAVQRELLRSGAPLGRDRCNGGA